MNDNQTVAKNAIRFFTEEGVIEIAPNGRNKWTKEMLKTCMETYFKGWTHLHYESAPEVSDKYQVGIAKDLNGKNWVVFYIGDTAYRQIYKEELAALRQINKAFKEAELPYYAYYQENWDKIMINKL